MNVKNERKLYDFNSKEDMILSESHPEETSNATPNFAQLKGIIIHQFLSEERKSEELESRIDWLLKEKIDKQFLDDQKYHDLKKNIKHDLKNFFKSKIYSNLSTFNNFKNEFEIYHHRDSYYLYGVIDKLIFDNNKIIVVDYKTDSIYAEEIEIKTEHYLVQLKFYGYIISKLYPTIREIELNLIFIKHPDKTLKFEVKIEDLKEIESDLDDMVKKTREFNPTKNLNHCEFCNFSIKNKCIVI
jgi:ATP-dependent exoDNAse (exonuclease V) beta subunit